jgi:hypothetical protein
MTRKSELTETIRWRDYVLLRNSEFDDFWRNHGNESGRRLLFIVGRGFDPRTALGIEKLATIANGCSVDLMALEFDEGESSLQVTLEDAVAKNWDRLQAAVMGRGEILTREIRFRSEDGHRVAARNAANVISSENVIEAYTDVVVDVSAMPHGVFFPVIARLLYFHDAMRKAGKAAPNIHVVVSEDPELDTNIREQGIDENASFLHPFEGEFNREAKGVNPAVWIPVLGEGRTAQFDRIYDLVKPDEVCPILPSPSRNPRRGDDIVLEYRDLLFDQLRVDPRNIIYASESNPFEVYRQIRQASLHYRDVMQLIGGCRISLSALCGKLMSLGVMLVAYELKANNILNVGVAHIECQGYEMPSEPLLNIEQVGLWVAGECYG